MPSEKPSTQAWTDAQACWQSFVQYPTYIHTDTAVRAIATALDAARNEGRREREGEIVAWAEKQAAIVRADGTTMLDAAWLAAYQQIGEDIKRGAGRRENDRG